MSDFKEFFSKNAESYARSSSHKSGADLESLIKSLGLKPGMKALDLATGTGFTAVALAREVSKVVAYDGTREMLDQAEKLAREENLENMEFVMGDVMALPFENSTFDVATCRRAAHHFTDMKKFLSEVFRVLKPGGKLGVSDMLRPENDGADIFNALERVRDSSHVGAIRSSTWKELLTEAGFQVDSMTVSDELYTVERWLSPVAMDSPQGKEVHKIISSNDKATLLDGNINGEEQTILKQRIILVASKQ